MTKSSRTSPNSGPDRLAPHSDEAEQAILGSIILEPSVIDRCITELTGDGVFYDLRHRSIYLAMVGLFDDGIPIDVVTLANRLKSSSQLEQIGGIGYLSALPDATPGAGNIDHYITICVEKHLLRQLVAAATQIVSDAYEEAIPVEEQMDKAEHRILKVSSKTAGKSSASARVLVNMAMEHLLELEQGTHVTGLPSGFRDLDRLTTGFHPKEMIVVAARPSVGKSSLILNMADHIAVEQKTPVGILSLEMPKERMMERMLAARARVNLRTLSAKVPADAEQLHAASKVLRTAPIYIDDERGISILKARAKARRMVVEQGVKILFVDYLQLLSGAESRRYENRSIEVGNISKGFYQLAGELNIPIVVLAQLSRELEKDKGNRGPRLSDLRDSGEIEQDADTVILLWPDDTAKNGNGSIVKVRLAKQRYGAKGVFDLMFFAGHTRFENAAQPEPEQETFYSTLATD